MISSTSQWVGICFFCKTPGHEIPIESPVFYSHLADSLGGDLPCNLTRQRKSHHSQMYLLLLKMADFHCYLRLLEGRVFDRKWYRLQKKIPVETAKNIHKNNQRDRHHYDNAGVSRKDPRYCTMKPEKKTAAWKAQKKLSNLALVFQ